MTDEFIPTGKGGRNYPTPQREARKTLLRLQGAIADMSLLIDNVKKNSGTTTAQKVVDKWEYHIETINDAIRLIDNPQ